ncbi:MAG: hypothetical protein IJ794_00075 [Lachnospiraceae bacterium]|nr:hypothetical protein [Lachnospiraceae bacterium]
MANGRMVISMTEIRCKSCNKLLGKFDGSGEIKCTRVSCSMVNRFDTKKKIHYTVKPYEHVPMGDRVTSSGVTFR